ncbi:hypothetical protein TNIN_63111 [Trichonephila inaurata madagascariensis]|uniref:Uncharacterized protein n=1 Tax=Trichonephila inaurata madagascariensis TaxID=2747483 RepID=A0A8X6WS97_9ARAC|nr:hypothetical protein TNIN_63111 [Trichonephila inaurata madagascariensis]
MLKVTWPPPLNVPYFPNPERVRENPRRKLKTKFRKHPNKTRNQLLPSFKPPKSHQMAARGNASSASENLLNNNKATLNLEALNANQNDSSEFGFLQAILEIQKIFTLFPSLLSEMKKSFSCTNPADRLNCLLKGVCSSLNSLTVNDV